MAEPIAPITDRLREYRIKYNDLVTEFNNVSSISTIVTDSNSITFPNGQKNVSIGIRGGTNITTARVGNEVQINLPSALTISDLVVSGITQLTGTTIIASGTITTASITNLTVGSPGVSYDFPTSAGSAGQALVFNASGNLVAGLGGTGVSEFKQLSDTPASYTDLGQRMLFLDGTEAGVANNVITDSAFTYDPTTDILKVPNITVDTQHQVGPYFEPFLPASIDYSSNATNIFSRGTFATAFEKSMLALVGDATNASGSNYNGLTIHMLSDSNRQNSIKIVNQNTGTVENLRNLDIDGSINQNITNFRDISIGHTISSDINNYTMIYGNALNTGSSSFDEFNFIDLGLALAGVNATNVNGLRMEFNGYSLDNVAIETINALHIVSSSGTVTNNTARDNSYSIRSELPLQSLFSGPVNVNMTTYGLTEPVLNVTSTSAGTPSGSPAEAIEIVYNGNTRYIPVYSAVT